MVMGEETLETQLAILGGGPGGYAAAFRAADRGLDVTLITDENRLGGTCLLRGCIPSKALLETSAMLQHVNDFAERGITFGKASVNLQDIIAWKDGIVNRLSSGLDTLAKHRDVNVINARGTFDSSTKIRLENAEIRYVKFQHAIIATGSSPTPIKGTEFQTGSRIIDSTAALSLDQIPNRLLVIGAGYIGLELGLFYASLGSKVTIIEMLESMLPGVDRDLVRPLSKKAEQLCEAIHYSTSVSSMEETAEGVSVQFKGKIQDKKQTFDRVLVSIGRQPNLQDLALENTKVKLGQDGSITVDLQRRTTDEQIYAVGDVTGNPLLAHKAVYEGKIVADVLAGEPAAFDAQAIPAVIYTDPEIAWCGLTETQARAEGLTIDVSRFPWGASGRALTMDTSDGLTKLIFDPQTQRLLGVGIVGRGAENLIAEGALAIEMGAVAQDLALTIHPHPTLSETLSGAADAYLGLPIDIMPPRRR